MKKNKMHIFVILSLMIFDAIAVNISYVAALYVRFFANGYFYSSAERYLPYILRFAPFYTIACLIVFFAFRLYHLIWRYVGRNDIRRIIFANTVTCFIQVIGTLVFVARMPITYYILGAFFQLLSTTFVRVIPRIIGSEDVSENSYPMGNSAGKLSIMVVGVRDNAHTLQERIEKKKKNMSRIVCFLDYKNEVGSGMSFNGVPVVSGIENLQTAIEKYHVDCVILTDSRLPYDKYEIIKKTCEECQVEIREFFVGTEHIYSRFMLPELLSVVSGPVTLIENGNVTSYDSINEAVKSTSDLKVISDLKAEEGSLSVTVKGVSTKAVNDQSWEENNNNEEPSFF